MTCRASGKRCFTSKRAAKRSCKGVSNKFRIYFCGRCHGYHITGRIGGTYR